MFQDNGKDMVIQQAWLAQQYDFYETSPHSEVLKGNASFSGTLHIYTNIKAITWSVSLLPAEWSHCISIGKSH